jgi:hypothetical protein
MMRAARIPILLSVLLAVACSGETPHAPAPGEIPPSRVEAVQQRPEFVPRGAASPAFEEEAVRLSATAGVGGEVTLRFRDGSPYATFRVAPETMRGATLQGRPVPAGTSVEITLRPVDPHRFIVDLQPSGLRFNPRAPAELEFAFRHAAASQRSPLTVWKQEGPGDPWSRIGPAEADGETKTLRVGLDGFTRYALATGH